MSFLFGLGRDLDLSLFVTPVSPQALLKKKILVKCFVSVVFLCFLEPSSLHILRKLYGQETSPAPYFSYLLFSGGQMATL